MNPTSGEIPYVPHPAVPDFASLSTLPERAMARCEGDTVLSFIPGRMCAVSGCSQGAGGGFSCANTMLTHQ